MAFHREPHAQAVEMLKDGIPALEEDWLHAFPGLGGWPGKPARIIFAASETGHDGDLQVMSQLGGPQHSLGAVLDFFFGCTGENDVGICMMRPQNQLPVPAHVDGSYAQLI